MKHTLLICFLIATAVYANSQQENIMPVGFEQVRIGMDWRSLVALRPDAKILNMMPDPGTNLKPDPEKPKGGLEEKLSAGSFVRVVYVFDNGVLATVMFAKEQTDSFKGERDQIIRQVAQKRGMPARIELVGNQRDQGVITWEDKNLHINVITPTDDAKLKKGVIGLQIMNRKYAEQIKAIGITGNVEKDNDLQGADKERLETLKSEVEKLLSVKDINPLKTNDLGTASGEGVSPVKQ